MSPSRPRTLSARVWIVALLAIVGCILFLLNALLPAFRGLTYGFPGYYAPSRLVVEGRWSTRIYDDIWYSEQVLTMTQGRISEKFSPHPPSTALLALPLAWLDLMTARAVWFVLNGLLLVGGILLLNAGFKRVPGISFGLEITAFALILAPVAENFRIGQAYVLLFFLFALAYWGLVRDQRAGVGFALGTAAIFKLSGGPLWLVLAARGRWRELAASVMVAFTFFVLTGLLLGWDTWLYFFSILPPYLRGDPHTSHLAFQTTPSFFQHVFVINAQWNPLPLLPMPWLAPLLTGLITFSALALTVWHSRRAPLDLAFGSALVLGVVLFPIAEEYHYSLMLFPLAVMAARLVQGPLDWRDAALFGLALLMLAAPLPYKANSLNDGWLALLAYPRLYGGWLLWLWLLKQMWPAPRAQSTSATRVGAAQPQ